MSQTQGGGETQFRAMLRLGAEAAPVEPDERSAPKASFGGPATALSGKCGGPPEAAQARNQLVDVVQSWAEELFRLRAKPAGPQSEKCRLDLGPPFHGRRKLRIWRWLGTLTQRACRLPHRARFPGGSYWRRAGRLICGLRIEILLVRSSGGALTVRRHVRTCANQQRTSRRGSLGAACRLNCCTAARVVRENTTAPAHELVLVA